MEADEVERLLHVSDQAGDGVNADFADLAVSEAQQEECVVAGDDDASQACADGRTCQPEPNRRTRRTPPSCGERVRRGEACRRCRHAPPWRLRSRPRRHGTPASHRCPGRRSHMRPSNCGRSGCLRSGPAFKDSPLLAGGLSMAISVDVGGVRRASSRGPGSAPVRPCLVGFK